MKCVILAGGRGTRLMEETQIRPKPMIEIGGRPILWHLMKIYSAQGIDDFIVCLGYKGYVIKEYFANYFLHVSDVTFDIANNRREIHQHTADPWRVTLVDTGEDSMTGGRLRRVRKYLGDEDFYFTYGDGLANVKLADLLRHHREQRTLATVTAVQPPGRFGTLHIEGPRVTSVVEKPGGDGGWINGGFFVLSPKVADDIAGDDSIWEREPMERLAREGQLAVYHHRDFWQPMDTMRDKVLLENLWASGRAPWKVWT